MTKHFPGETTDTHGAALSERAMARHVAELKQMCARHVPMADITTWLVHEEEVAGLPAGALRQFHARTLGRYARAEDKRRAQDTHYGPRVNATPDKRDFGSRAAYEEASATWLEDLYRPLLQEAPTLRPMLNGQVVQPTMAGARLEQVITVSRAERDADRDAAELRYFQQRVAADDLTVSERLAYYRTFGQAPDGKRLPDAQEHLYHVVYQPSDAGRREE
jgi:hypothetical protein